MRLDNEPRPWNVAAVQTWPGFSLLARARWHPEYAEHCAGRPVKLGGSDDLLLESCEEQWRECGDACQTGQQLAPGSEGELAPFA